MDLVSTIAAAVLAGLNYVLGFYLFLVFANMVLSFVAADQGNGIVRFVSALVEPPCRMIRSRFPGLAIRSGSAMIDLAPLILILAIGVIRIFLTYLHDYVQRGGGLGL